MFFVSQPVHGVYLDLLCVFLCFYGWDSFLNDLFLQGSVLLGPFWSVKAEDTQLKMGRLSY